jgi:hypothetical protein
MQPGGATLDGMQPTEFLSRHGGAARLAHLRRAGFSRSQISQAVNSGLRISQPACADCSPEPAMAGRVRCSTS